MKNVHEFYPELIVGLPEADIPFNGVRGWLLQGTDHQLIFFEIEPIGEVAEHSHGAQWGTVLEGELELTIGGITKTYAKGDSYYIEAGTLHSAVVGKKTWVIDFFADKNRYNVKQDA